MKRLNIAIKLATDIAMSIARDGPTFYTITYDDMERIQATSLRGGVQPQAVAAAMTSMLMCLYVCSR